MRHEWTGVPTRLIGAPYDELRSMTEDVMDNDEIAIPRGALIRSEVKVPGHIEDVAKNFGCHCQNGLVRRRDGGARECSELEVGVDA